MYSKIMSLMWNWNRWKIWSNEVISNVLQNNVSRLASIRKREYGFSIESNWDFGLLLLLFTLFVRFVIISVDNNVWTCYRNQNRYLWRKKLCVATVTKEMCHHIYFRHGINSFLAFNIYSVDSWTVNIYERHQHLFFRWKFIFRTKSTRKSWGWFCFGSLAYV